MTEAAGAEVAVILNQTPFYGESGGQVGDTGVIAAADGLRIRVTDTQKKLGDLFVHLGASRPARKVGMPVVARWTMRGGPRSGRTTPRRICCMRRCGAKLGTHVAQKGSLNAPDRLRFDVSQPRPITADELPGSRRW